jgi:hypothetical protein
MNRVDGFLVTDGLEKPSPLSVDGQVLSRRKDADHGQKPPSLNAAKSASKA